MGKDYSKHADTHWIEDTQVKEEKTIPDPQTEHLRLLAESGFNRVADNIIGLMKGYNGVGSWNPLHNVRHNHTDTAQSLIGFCEYLQSNKTDAVDHINAINELDQAAQAEAFVLLYQAHKDPNDWQNFNRFMREREKDKTYLGKSPDAVKIYGILSVVQKLFDPEKPIGSSSFNDRLAWILKKELLSKQQIDKECEMNVGITSIRNNQEVPIRKYTEGDVISKEAKDCLAVFHKTYVQDKLKPLPKLDKITFQHKLGEDSTTLLTIDMNQEVPVSMGFKGFFGCKTKLSFKKYLSWMLIHADAANKAKYQNIMKVLENPDLDQRTVNNLRFVLAEARIEKNKKMVLESRHGETTGEKLLDAFIQHRKAQAKTSENAHEAAQQKKIQRN